MINNPHRFNLEWWFRFTAPLYVYRTGARMLGNTHHIEASQKLTRAAKQGERVCDLFKAFTKSEYFNASHAAEAYAAEAERQMVNGDGGTGRYQPRLNPFNVDAREIVWNTYMTGFGYGIRRFILNEDMTPLPEGVLQHTDLQQTSTNLFDWDGDHHPVSFPSLFPDLTWAYTHSRRPGYTRRGVLGRLLGWTGWREGKSDGSAGHISHTTLRSRAEMQALVLSSAQVRGATARLDRARGAEKRNSDERTDDGSDSLSRARAIISDMAADMNVNRARPASLVLRKAWRSLYDSINVDEEGLARVRVLLEGQQLAKTKKKQTQTKNKKKKKSKKHKKKKKGSQTQNTTEGVLPVPPSPRPAGGGTVVLVPSHRSYIDFIIISYIFFAYNMPMPHIAAGDWIKRLGPMAPYMRNAGAFVIRRSFQSVPDNSVGANGSGDDTEAAAERNLYAAVFQTYVQQLMSDGESVEFFLEGTRSRTGKSLAPKTGMLQSIVGPWLEANREAWQPPPLQQQQQQQAEDEGLGGEGSGPLSFTSGSALLANDLHFVPVTIDYERTLELSAMARETLGENKKAESLPGLVRWVVTEAAKSLGGSAAAFISAIGLPAWERRVRMQVSTGRPAGETFFSWSFLRLALFSSVMFSSQFHILNVHCRAAPRSLDGPGW